MGNIILIGYMGSGKTTVGRCIAGLSGHTFVDTDEMIEQEQQRSVSQIFAIDGEQAFRDMETALLEKLIAGGNAQMVISTGGGMPVREKNRPLLQRLGRVFYLKAGAQTIYGRIRGDVSRPLLQCPDPEERIKEMLAAREPAYEAAAYAAVEVDALEPHEAARRIIAQAEKGE